MLLHSQLVSILLLTVGDSLVCGQAILEVAKDCVSGLTIALFIVGFFEWAIVWLTNWQKQVKIAYAR